MSFVTALALGIAALVAAPYLAHRLRRKRAEEQPFAAARLVPKTPPKARRRSKLEDRSLFAIRAASIVALAVLGASPLVRCSRLALTRSGASVAVAIVLDDSMSMRVEDASGRSAFARAKDGASEILASLRDGDAAAIVLAGAPARVGLAATTDVSAARAALASMTESDRATDLDGALAIAKTLIGELPQVDRRIIVLSDRADGKPDAPPLGEGAELPVWMAMPELAARADQGAGSSDCAVLAADRAGGRVRVRFACSSVDAAASREVRLMRGDDVLTTVPLPKTALGEAVLSISGDVPDMTAALTGRDAVAADDVAPVVVQAGPAALAVVGDASEESVATGGAPVLEQALSALRVDMAVRPLPQIPDRREDMAPFAAMILDDPPGFTPEQRHVLGTFVERGGLLFVALGRRAAAAPLGASFEPFLSHGVTWSDSPAKGADPASGATRFGAAAASLVDLAPRGRALLKEQDAAAFEPLVRWSDHALLLGRRAKGRGEAWIATLPISIDVSDLALRPGFLSILDAFVAEARERAAPLRGDVGAPWAFAGAREVSVKGPAGEVTPTREDGAWRVVPTRVGAYHVKVDGEEELRVAAPIAREVDLRPRRAAPAATSSDLGGGVAVVDVSWAIALVLLALVAAEIVVRALVRDRAEPASS